MPDSSPPCVARPIRIDPPLEPAEVEFLLGFTVDSPVRRVWPGQPTSHTPWHPTADGRYLELDPVAARQDLDVVIDWLRFLSRAFLAPSSPGALEVALAQGLRAGHRIDGEVTVGSRVVVVVDNRVTERDDRTGGPDGTLRQLRLPGEDGC